MTSIRQGHEAADALDWNEALRLIDRMADDGQYRDSLVVASGCYLGLRVSDLLRLKWEDLLADDFYVVEKKTGKKRHIRVNATFQKKAKALRKALGNPPLDSYAFSRKRGDAPISRQAVDLMLKKAKVRYRIKSARIFSSHSLRKTFGRRVWLQGCDKGSGEKALLLLCDVFGHSSISITKRYLGIRHEEILSVYDALD